MTHQRALLASPFSFPWFFLFLTLPLYGKASSFSENVTKDEESPVIGKSEWRRITSTEYGEVSTIDVNGGHRSPFHLQLFTLEPNSLFLPVLLHADMLFYVHTGSGRLIWAYDGDTKRINLRQGDICMLGTGHVFYLQSNLEAQRQRLRIFAIFPNSIHNHYDPAIGAYSRISELVGGFDQKIMQAAFGVPEELAAEISNKTETPAIVHAVSKEKNNILELEAWILHRVLGGEIATDVSSNNNKPRTFNVFDKHPDFKNRYGWSLMVTQKHLKSLKHINVGFLMVNLTAGAMMGPHWNPLAAEIAMVLEGEGMVRVVCGSSNMDKSKCQNMRFKVKQGDVFMVPKFHPMAQMSFNNDSLVFLGFSTTTKKTYPQFLAGERSVLQTIDKHILAASFNVSDETIKQLLHSQEGSIILGCASCAEEEERILIEEAKRREEERRRKEEARRREEEEARRREEEKRRQEEEEEARREEKRRQEEEEARRREEEKRREEEEARREAEEEQKREEEEKAKEEQGAMRQQERREEERRREEEKARRRREEEAKEEQERTRQEEEEAERERERAREEQEERQRRRPEEEAKEEQEQARRKKQETAEMEQERARKEQEERERRRQQEEEVEEEQEQIRRQEEKATKEQEQSRKEQEERETRRQKEEAEEMQEQARRHGEKEAKKEQERARKEQEKRERRRQKEEAEEEQEQVRKQEEEEEEEATSDQEQSRKEQEEREMGVKRKKQKKCKNKQGDREKEAKREQERARKEQEERERRHQNEEAEEEQVRRQQEEQATREQERSRKEQEEREMRRQKEEAEEMQD